jgi:hypothetical protein
MASLSLLSFLLPIAKGIHMSITITMNTSTHTMSSRRGNRRRDRRHSSRRTSNQRTCSQGRRNPQEASILKMSLLITNLSKIIHQWNTRVMSKQLSTKRLKLIMKLSQEVIRVTKLKSSLLILAWLLSGRRQLRINSVNLMPNSKELIEESINGIITLVKKLLLTNSNKKSSSDCEEKSSSDETAQAPQYQ